MAYSSGLMMLLFLFLGEAAGAGPVEFKVVDAETGDPLPAVTVRQLPPTWEIHFIFKRSRAMELLAARNTNVAGKISCEATSRGTYFFETEDYYSIDVRKNWFGMKAYEEPYTHATEVKCVDGVYIIPLRRKTETTVSDETQEKSFKQR